MFFSSTFWGQRGPRNSLHVDLKTLDQKAAVWCACAWPYLTTCFWTITSFAALGQFKKRPIESRWLSTLTKQGKSMGVLTKHEHVLGLLTAKKCCNLFTTYIYCTCILTHSWEKKIDFNWLILCDRNYGLQTTMVTTVIYYFCLLFFFVLQRLWKILIVGCWCVRVNTRLCPKAIV